MTLTVGKGGDHATLPEALAALRHRRGMTLRIRIAQALLRAGCRIGLWEPYGYHAYRTAEGMLRTRTTYAVRGGGDLRWDDEVKQF